MQYEQRYRPERIVRLKIMHGHFLTPQDYYLSRYAYKFVLLNEQTDFIKSGAPKVVFSVGKLSFKMERMILKNYRNVTNNESMGNHYES